MTIPTENTQETEVDSDESAAEILISHKQLLTATGGPFELKPELRQLCALTSDGILYVSAQHQTDAYVMAFEDQLEHENHPFEVKVCSMSTIKALYHRTGGRRHYSRCNSDALMSGGHTIAYKLAS